MNERRSVYAARPGFSHRHSKARSVSVSLAADKWLDAILVSVGEPYNPFAVLV